MNFCGKRQSGYYQAKKMNQGIITTSEIIANSIINLPLLLGKLKIKSSLFSYQNHFHCRSKIQNVILILHYAPNFQSTPNVDVYKTNYNLN